MKLDDGAVRVFINTEGTNRGDFSREFLDFMEYIEKTTDEKPKILRVNGSGRYMGGSVIRKSKKVGIKYMQRWKELAYAREDDIKEGRTEGKIEDVLRLLEMIEPVSKELREKIMAETDDRIRGNWLRIAARANNISEFIEEME